MSISDYFDMTTSHRIIFHRIILLWILYINICYCKRRFNHYYTNDDNNSNLYPNGDDSYVVFNGSDAYIRTLLERDSESHRVISLPGLDASVNLVHYAGHVTVDPNGRGNFFYWLFEAASDPSNKPLIIWLNGGPGCSSMDGLFLEVGPLRIDGANSNQIKINPYSWHNIANLLFIDQPVGTGLSFTMNRNSYPRSDDDVNRHFLSFLDEFFRLHPRYKKESNGKVTSRPLIFAGESHAGHYIPSIVAAIMKRNTMIISSSSDSNTIIQLHGIALGNPWIDPLHQYDASDIAHGVGIISLGQKAVLKEMERSCQDNIRQGKLNTRVCFNLLDDIIDSSSTAGAARMLMYDSRKYSSNAHSFPPGHTAVEAYLNQPAVRLAIHASSCPHKYVECADNPYNALAHQDAKGVTKELTELLEAGVQVLIYAGQYDLICNHVGVEKALMLLPWSKKDEWSKAQPGVWIRDNQPAGYVKTFQNLQYLRVLNSGHMVPMDLPEIASDMLDRFIQNNGFNSGSTKIGEQSVDPLSVDCLDPNAIGAGGAGSKARKTFRGKRSDTRIIP